MALSLATVVAALRPSGLSVTGGFRPGPGDGAPAGTAMLCLVGAADGAMWAAFSTAPEAADGASDPLDRWSKRVLDAAAAELGATALYPFGGPPWSPFLAWAARAEGATASPIGMSVTAARGLHASWRGALAFDEAFALPNAPVEGPCTGCPRPCVTACPVDAFATGRYDTAACVAHLTSPEGAPCRSGGCLARLACPATLALPRAQRVFHLEAFLGARLG